jgi:hypothetical protein
MERRYIYTDEDLTWGESTLALWQTPLAPGEKSDRWTWAEEPQLGRALLRIAIAGEEVLAAARAWKAIRAGQLNPEAIIGGLTVQQALTEGVEVGGHQETADSYGQEVGDLYALAQGALLDVYRHARAVDGYILKPDPPQLGGWQVPIIVVGGAALVVGSWLVAKEVAPAWQAIESERAWSAAKAYAEITTNKALIASGQKPILTDWAKLRSSVARVQQSRWTHFAAGAGVGAIGLMGAYYGLTKIGEKRSRPRRAPRRANPSRRSPARRRNQQQRFHFTDPEARQPELPKTSPQHKRRTRGPALKKGSAAELEAARVRGWLDFQGQPWVVFERMSGTFKPGAWRYVASTSKERAAYELALDYAWQEPKRAVGYASKRAGGPVWAQQSVDKTTAAYRASQPKPAFASKPERKPKKTSKPKPKPKRMILPDAKTRAELAYHIERGWVGPTSGRRYSVAARRRTGGGEGAWRTIGSGPAPEMYKLASWHRAHKGEAVGVLDWERAEKIRSYEQEPGDWRPNPKRKRRKNPSARELHDIATREADRAVDNAITRQLSRWPNYPRAADVDRLADELGRWPGKREWELYRAAWFEQVQRRRLKHKQGSKPERTAATVRANPKRDKRGRFASRRRSTSTKKRTSPKGRTRGTRRGKGQRGGGRK